MQARRLPARHGALWVIAGFRLFRANPPLLTALTLGFMFLALVINLLPLVGPFLLPLALPALNLIVANGCRAAERGGPLAPGALKIGLEQNAHHLLRLGGLHLVGSLLVLLASYGLDAGMDLAEPERSNPADMVAFMLRLLALAAPAIMALWFSPLLTGWDGIPATKAVFFSAYGAFSNWRAFLAYGATVGAIGVLLPGLVLVVAGLVSQSLLNALFLALRIVMVFVFAPALMASVYLSYRDVFHTDDER